MSSRGDRAVEMLNKLYFAYDVGYECGAEAFGDPTIEIDNPYDYGDSGRLLYRLWQAGWADALLNYQPDTGLLDLPPACTECDGRGQTMDVVDWHAEPCAECEGTGYQA